MGDHLKNGLKHSKPRSCYEKSVGIGWQLLETNLKPKLRKTIASRPNQRNRDADQASNLRGSESRVRRHQSLDSYSKRKRDRS